MARREAPKSTSKSPKKSAKAGTSAPPPADATDDLDALLKKDLVARAEALGIDGASKYTKVELVDEIRRAEGKRSRGLLGKARDLLKDVVEKGIAATQTASLATPAPAKREAREARVSATAAKKKIAAPPPPPVPTITLAEIYLAQGHAARAKAIVREVLRGTPDDSAAKALLAKIDGANEAKDAPAPIVATAKHVDVPMAHATTDPGAPI